MNAAQDVLKRVLLTLIYEHVFFGSLGLRLKLQESERTQTAATDGQHLLYNAKFVLSLTKPELIFLWAHEVMHCALNHHTRRGKRDPELWNQAADYVINLVLVDSKIGKMPADGLLDEQYRGMSTERVYEILRRQQEQQHQKPQAGQSAGQPQQGAAQQAPGAGQGQQPKPAQAGQQPGQGGSGPVDPVKQMWGAVLDAPDPIANETEWAVATQEAIMSARKRGHMPGGLAVAFKEATKPRVDWRDVLRQFVQTQAKNDYSWRLPNRRYVQQGLYLPALRSEEMGPIVLAFDTSGSTDFARKSFVYESDSIVCEVQPEEVIALQCDTRIVKVDRFARSEALEINRWYGNDGTEFHPVFDWVQREGIQPACLIYLTDGFGDFPKEQPTYPVLWALCGMRDPAWPKVTPPWGEVVEIDVNA